LAAIDDAGDTAGDLQVGVGIAGRKEVAGIVAGFGRRRRSRSYSANRAWG
jgi:hypothetical protein